MDDNQNENYSILGLEIYSYIVYIPLMVYSYMVYPL